MIAIEATAAESTTTIAVNTPVLVEVELTLIIIVDHHRLVVVTIRKIDLRAVGNGIGNGTETTITIVLRVHHSSSRHHHPRPPAGVRIIRKEITTMAELTMVTDRNNTISGDREPPALGLVQVVTIIVIMGMDQVQAQA